MSEKKRDLGDITPERFEELKAKFVAATSADERMNVFGLLLNDVVREEFKRWARKNDPHVSSAVQDCFMNLVRKFDPKQFIPVEGREEKKARPDGSVSVDYFDEFNDLDHFIAYARTSLRRALGAYWKKEKERPTTAPSDTIPEPAVENTPLSGLISSAHFKYMIDCFRREFNEKDPSGKTFEIFTRHGLEGLSYPEVVARLREEGYGEITEKQASVIYRSAQERGRQIYQYCAEGRYHLLKLSAQTLADLNVRLPLELT